MKLSDLSPETIEKIKTIRYDQILEKHEGPWKWESEFQYGSPEIMRIENQNVLLPLEEKQHRNITILRVIVSEDSKTLVIFLKDTTYYNDPFASGYIAICEKFPGEDFYVATVYHEWFILENDSLTG